MFPLTPFFLKRHNIFHSLLEYFIDIYQDNIIIFKSFIYIYIVNVHAIKKITYINI